MFSNKRNFFLNFPDNLTQIKLNETILELNSSCLSLQRLCNTNKYFVFSLLMNPTRLSKPLNYDILLDQYFIDLNYFLFILKYGKSVVKEKLDKIVNFDNLLLINNVYYNEAICTYYDIILSHEVTNFKFNKKYLTTFEVLILLKRLNIKATYEDYNKNIHDKIMPEFPINNEKSTSFCLIYLVLGMIDFMQSKKCYKNYLKMAFDSNFYRHIYHLLTKATIQGTNLHKIIQKMAYNIFYVMFSLFDPQSLYIPQSFFKILAAIFEDQPELVTDFWNSRACDLGIANFLNLFSPTNNLNVIELYSLMGTTSFDNLYKSLNIVCSIKDNVDCVSNYVQIFTNASNLLNQTEKFFLKCKKTHDVLLDDFTSQQNISTCKLGKAGLINLSSWIELSTTISNDISMCHSTCNLLWSIHNYEHLIQQCIKNDVNAFISFNMHLIEMTINLINYSSNHLIPLSYLSLNKSSNNRLSNDNQADDLYKIYDISFRIISNGFTHLFNLMKNELMIKILPETLKISTNLLESIINYSKTNYSVLKSQQYAMLHCGDDEDDDCENFDMLDIALRLHDTGHCSSEYLSNFILSYTLLSNEICHYLLNEKTHLYYTFIVGNMDFTAIRLIPLLLDDVLFNDKVKYIRCCLNIMELVHTSLNAEFNNKKLVEPRQALNHFLVSDHLLGIIKLCTHFIIWAYLIYNNDRRSTLYQTTTFLDIKNVAKICEYDKIYLYDVIQECLCLSLSNLIFLIEGIDLINPNMRPQLFKTIFDYDKTGQTDLTLVNVLIGYIIRSFNFEVKLKGNEQLNKNTLMVVVQARILVLCLKLFPNFFTTNIGISNACGFKRSIVHYFSYTDLQSILQPFPNNSDDFKDLFKKDLNKQISPELIFFSQAIFGILALLNNNLNSLREPQPPNAIKQELDETVSYDNYTEQNISNLSRVIITSLYGLLTGLLNEKNNLESFGLLINPFTVSSCKYEQSNTSINLDTLLAMEQQQQQAIFDKILCPFLKSDSSILTVTNPWDAILSGLWINSNFVNKLWYFFLPALSGVSVIKDVTFVPCLMNIHVSCTHLIFDMLNWCKPATFITKELLVMLERVEFLKLYCENNIPTYMTLFFDRSLNSAEVVKNIVLSCSNNTQNVKINYEVYCDTIQLALQDFTFGLGIFGNLIKPEMIQSMDDANSSNIKNVTERVVQIFLNSPPILINGDGKQNTMKTEVDATTFASLFSTTISYNGKNKKIRGVLVEFAAGFIACFQAFNTILTYYPKDSLQSKYGSSLLRTCTNYIFQCDNLFESLISSLDDLPRIANFKPDEDVEVFLKSRFQLAQTMLNLAKHCCLISSLHKCDLPLKFQKLEDVSYLIKSVFDSFISLYETVLKLVFKIYQLSNKFIISDLKLLDSILTIYRDSLEIIYALQQLIVMRKNVNRKRSESCDGIPSLSLLIVSMYKVQAVLTQLTAFTLDTTCNQLMLEITSNHLLYQTLDNISATQINHNDDTVLQCSNNIVAFIKSSCTPHYFDANRDLEYLADARKLIYGLGFFNQLLVLFSMSYKNLKNQLTFTSLSSDNYFRQIEFIGININAVIYNKNVLEILGTRLEKKNEQLNDIRNLRLTNVFTSLATSLLATALSISSNSRYFITKPNEGKYNKLLYSKIIGLYPFTFLSTSVIPLNSIYDYIYTNYCSCLNTTLTSFLLFQEPSKNIKNYKVSPPALTPLLAGFEGVKKLAKPSFDSAVNVGTIDIFDRFELSYQSVIRQSKYLEMLLTCKFNINHLYSPQIYEDGVLVDVLRLVINQCTAFLSKPLTLENQCIIVTNWLKSQSTFHSRAIHLPQNESNEYPMFLLKTRLYHLLKPYVTIIKCLCPDLCQLFTYLCRSTSSHVHSKTPFNFYPQFFKPDLADFDAFNLKNESNPFYIGSFGTMLCLLKMCLKELEYMSHQSFTLGSTGAPISPISKMKNIHKSSTNIIKTANSEPNESISMSPYSQYTLSRRRSSPFNEKRKSLILRSMSEEPQKIKNYLKTKSAVVTEDDNEDIYDLPEIKNYERNVLDILEMTLYIIVSQMFIFTIGAKRDMEWDGKIFKDDLCKELTALLEAFPCPDINYDGRRQGKKFKPFYPIQNIIQQIMDDSKNGNSPDDNVSDGDISFKYFELMTNLVVYIQNI